MKGRMSRNLVCAGPLPSRDSPTPVRNTAGLVSRAPGQIRIALGFSRSLFSSWGASCRGYRARFYPVWCVDRLFPFQFLLILEVVLKPLLCIGRAFVPSGSYTTDAIPNSIGRSGGGRIHLPDDLNQQALDPRFGGRQLRPRTECRRQLAQNGVVRRRPGAEPLVVDGRVGI